MRAMGGWLLASIAVGVSVVVACGEDDVTVAPPSDEDAGAVVLDASNGVDASDAGGTTLGGVCTTDADCAAGLECLREATQPSQWPAHGICTLKCDATDVRAPAGESTCAAHTPGSHCARVGSSQGYCLEGCTFGPKNHASLVSGPIATKCHGRADMGCGRLLNETYGCFPVCNADAACEGAGKCTVSGFCTKGDVAGWDAIGEVGTTCKLSTGGTDGFCTASCVIGVAPSCGWTGIGTKAQAACLLAESGAGIGDRGLCARVCDCETDCDAPYKCSPLSPRFASESGRRGLCTKTPTSNLTCGDAGVDGGADAGDGG